MSGTAYQSLYSHLLILLAPCWYPWLRSNQPKGWILSHNSAIPSGSLHVIGTWGDNATCLGCLIHNMAMTWP